MTTFSIAAGPRADLFARACRRLDDSQFVDALWRRSPAIWSADRRVQDVVTGRLGWLDALDFVEPRLPRLQELAASIFEAGFTDIVLLGMGGSSLAPEVLRQVVGVSPGYPRFRMLDSIDPDAVRAAMENAATSLFIVASKSGTTIEPNALAAEARRRVMAAGHEWGSRVIAITDEDTALHQRARAERYRDVFVNPSDIGGRYSALSFFGMVPAALMGADLDRLVGSGRAMEAACQAQTAAENPGAALGAWMAAGVTAGQNKLSLRLPDAWRSFALWIEQLVAESTGKNGTGVVPVVEGPGSPTGTDRVIVAYADAAGADAALTISPTDPSAIAGEFFRWEFATAAAAAILEVNPFDEPNVALAKTATRRLLDRFSAQRRLEPPSPHGAMATGVRLTLSRAASESLSGAPAQAFLRTMKAGDYLGLLVYLPPDDPRFESAIQKSLERFASTLGCAITLGYGPRYLHSTGQLHKGGADNGVFIVVTASVADDLAIPGEPFSFEVLERAQALGDFSSLDERGRRALYVHMPRRDPALIAALTDALLSSR